jgi:hypothetical protein
VKPKSLEPDDERVEGCSLELFDDRYEVRQRTDWLEGRRIVWSESTSAGGKNEGSLHGVQRRSLFEETFGEATIISAG